MILNLLFEFVTGREGHHTTRLNGYGLARARVAPWSRRLRADREVSKTSDFDVIPSTQAF